MKQQILFIHGGEAFDSYEDYIDFLSEKRQVKIEDLKGKVRWRGHLQKELGDNYEVLLPQMPCGWNAKYSEWKIWFEKLFPFFQENIILIGGSLGGIFLAKYLSENNFPLKIKATFLLAAPFDAKDREADYTLGDFALGESLEKFSAQCPKIFLYHSEDDPVVPLADVEKYAQKLPNAEKIIFKNKGHFNLEEFPEIVAKIKNLK